jgi:bZIP transcription factor
LSTRQEALNAVLFTTQQKSDTFGHFRLNSFVMGDLVGVELFDRSAQPSAADLSFQPHTFSLDFFQRQTSFGFSPGTSPAPLGVKSEGSDSFFHAQNRNMPLAGTTFIGPNDFGYQSSSQSNFYQPASPSVTQPSRLYIPSTTSKERHGQLTPPSETTPTKDSPLAEASKEPGISPVETRSGPTTRKRRSTQQNQVSEPMPQPATTPRRRKKSTRKQSSATDSAADGDGKRSQFLERNRVAASKCRQKKKEWTSNLEHRARELQASKTHLSLLVSSLREELLYLKGEALRHTTCDCNSVREYLARNAEASFPHSHLSYPNSPQSGSNFSFEAMDLDPTLMHGSPRSSTATDAQILPELNLLGQIPD